MWNRTTGKYMMDVLRIARIFVLWRAFQTFMKCQTRNLLFNLSVGLLFYIHCCT